MGQFIIKLEDKYLIWSSIVDAPITMGWTLEELTDHVREESGRRGLDELPARLARVEQKGTSATQDDHVVDTIWLNRAGAGETCMSIDQIIEYYVRNGDPQKPRPRGENEPPVYPKVKLDGFRLRKARE